MFGTNGNDKKFTQSEAVASESVLKRMRETPATDLIIIDSAGEFQRPHDDAPYRSWATGRHAAIHESGTSGRCAGGNRYAQ